jgi:hypothetical protein
MYAIFFFLFGIIAYFIDKTRHFSSPNDDFRGDNLFFRYGTEITSLIIPIGVDSTKTSKSMNDLYTELNNSITKELNAQFSASKAFSFDGIQVKDLKMENDVRYFLRFSFTTKRNSKLHFFIYAPIIGKQLIIHESIYLDGNYYWYDVLRFIFFSPVTMFIWGRKWLMREYSIINSMTNRFSKSSFDYIDTLTLMRTLHFIIQIQIKEFARRNNLLSDELNNLLTQNINSTQNININQSSGISFGNLTSSAKS